MVLTILPGTAFAADVVDSGTCGENVTWTLDSNGVLTVSGTGVVGAPDHGKLWSDYYPLLSRVRIADGITGIGERAFAGCPMEKIEIPDSVTSIGAGAFYACSCLETITIPDGVTSIADDTFYDCHGLTGITIPESVTSIGKNAFAACSSLISIPIPAGVTSIGSGAFAECKGLRSVVLPEGVTQIGEYTFQFCDQLTDLTIGKNITTICDHAFFGCNSLTDVYYTGSEAQWQTIAIGAESTALTGADFHYNSIGPEITLYTLFQDMPTMRNWAYPGIAYCVAHELMYGMSSDSFDPNGQLTRGQLVTILWRLEGCPEPKGSPQFTDLKQGWYWKAIAWATEQHVAYGLDDTTFAPDRPIMRQEIVTFMYRYQKECIGAILTPVNTENLAQFPDANKVAGYAVDAMSWAISIGLVAGNSIDGVVYLDPAGSATRAQAAALLMRYHR